ncbi:hypothetical protein SAMN02745196_00769 [Clostridium collagenovorans DSM 3089]|uniref:Uncharacterized protein n=1 Tax=Clostridium collagenovorans DSM 3089 TaxID=1121306 RepID=A0A1M5TY91_9CLOT|nr:hypothetical protein [Clostridium collagenovorans]SHH55709.1 hypothetical protein SAMN02745196_00769 [Clostridium collagenovorans DSM 3089]
MINKKEIIEYLSDFQLECIKEIKVEKDLIIFKFELELEDSEIEAAEAFADEECEEPKKSEEWYEEHFLPYLSDMAIDDVEEMIQECAEEFDLDYELIMLDISEEKYDSIEFLGAFLCNGKEVYLEEYISEII